MRSPLRTIRFVITDTFKSRGGAVPTDPSPSRMLRDTFAVARGTAAGLDATDVDAGTAQRYSASFDD